MESPDFPSLARALERLDDVLMAEPVRAQSGDAGVILRAVGVA